MSLDGGAETILGKTSVANEESPLGLTCFDEDGCSFAIEVDSISPTKDDLVFLDLAHALIDERVGDALDNLCLLLSNWFDTSLCVEFFGGLIVNFLLELDWDEEEDVLRGICFVDLYFVGFSLGGFRFNLVIKLAAAADVDSWSSTGITIGDGFPFGEIVVDLIYTFGGERPEFFFKSGDPVVDDDLDDLPFDTVNFSFLYESGSGSVDDFG